jgi:multiple sugar transport system substrate-binding protein
MKKIDRRSFLKGMAACAAMAGLSACGSAASSSTAASTASSAASAAASSAASAAPADFSGRTVTVGLWGGNDQETAAVDTLKSNFEKAHNCTVELKVYTDYNTQLQADLIGQTAPDTFYVDGSMFAFYSGLGVMDTLEPADYELDAFYDNLVSAFTTADGSVLCIPKDCSTLATYYNETMLSDCGFTGDDIPDTYDAYKDFLTQLQAKLDEKYGKGTVAAMTYNQDLARNLFILQDGSSGLCDADGNSTLNQEPVVKNLQFILDLVDAGVWKTPSDLGTGWNGEAFGTGKCAIMEEGNWVYGTLKKDYSDIQFGCKGMPKYNGTQYSMIYTVGYGIYSASQNKDMAAEWIKYVTSVDGETIWCTGAGCLPPRSDAAEAMDVESDPVWKVHSEMTPVALPWQLGKNLALINTAYQNYLPQAVSGDMTAAECLEAADKQANDQIANAG